MIEKRTQQTLLTIIVARFYQNKHSMAMVDHKVGKHYFQVLAEMNKMVNRAAPYHSLAALKQSVVSMSSISDGQG